MQASLSSFFLAKPNVFSSPLILNKLHLLYNCRDDGVPVSAFDSGDVYRYVVTCERSQMFVLEHLSSTSKYTKQTEKNPEIRLKNITIGANK